MSHAELINRAAKWLRSRCVIVATDLVTGGETPDAIGWQGSGVTILVEAKASRADFLSDKRKYFRRDPRRGVGELRYYIAPKGMLSLEDLPEGWGLLEVCGKVIRQKVEATMFAELDKRAETRMLLSLLRRVGHDAPEGVSIKAYTYQIENPRTTLGVGIEEQPE